jgi:hypothetical protein
LSELAFSFQETTMIERRGLIGSAVAAGVAGFAAGGASPAEAADDGKVAAAVEGLRRSFERQFDSTELGPSPYISKIRQVQRTHLMAAQRYPAFIEVGIDTWEHVYDWHVKHLQQIQARQLADGRYAMTFMFTTLLLRPDLAPEYVGPPYDVAPRP